MSILTDNFNDNTRDTTKWALGTVIFENAAVGVAEANGQIEITPLANEASPAIYGYKSATTYDFSGLSAQVRIAADFGTPSEAWLIVALDNDNYFRIWAVGGGNLFTRSRVGANNTNEDHGVFTFATHTYWKIRHDKVTDEIVFEYSSDGLSWTQLRRIARPFAITSTTIYLSGGSGGSSPTPPVVKFDDLIVQGSNAPALFRGRNFPLFDDDEVNRFEFWPAVTAGAATTYERAADVSATGSIASTGQFLSVFERASTVSATGSIASAAESFSVFERATTTSATATIDSAAQFFSVLERSSATSATGSVEVTGTRIVERSVSLSGTATIATVAESFSILERSVSLSATASVESSAISFSILQSAATVNATASIEASGVGFSVFESAVAISANATITASGISFSVTERAIAIDATGLIATSGLRIIERSLSITAAAQISTNAESFSVFERASSLSATTSIESVAQFFSIFERSTSVDSLASIIVTRQVELFRQVAITATASISVSGNVIPPGAVEHERSVTVAATGEIASSAISFSVATGIVEVVGTAQISVAGLTVRERFGAVATSAVIEVDHQRELQRTIDLSATATITTSGVVSAPEAGVFERAVTLNAVGTITASATVYHRTPSGRTFVITSPQREVVIEAARVYVIPSADREEVGA